MLSGEAAGKIALAGAAALPAMALRLHPIALPPLVEILVFGGAVVGASFLLAWTAEAARTDISGSLATALLALVAVLPEYAVDLWFSWSSGHDPSMARYAAANMTGSNRLLLGLGWPLCLLLLRLGQRRRNRRDPESRETLAVEIRLQPGRRLDLGVLGLAALWSLGLPLRRGIGLGDAALLLALFAFYLWRAAQVEHTEAEQIGVAEAIAGLPAQQRRALVIGLFLFAALVVLAAAQPFADALVRGGRALGLDEFLLVQWLAPLASEAPEFLVAAVLALRGNGDAALGTLLSSKVNQWTLLIGSLPIAHAVGGGTGPLPLDARQVEEVALTAAQTLLGFAVLCDLHLRRWEAWALLALFGGQLIFPQTQVRLGFAGSYLLLAAATLVARRRELPAIARALGAAGRG